MPQGNRFSLARLSTIILVVVFLLHEASRAYAPDLLSNSALPTITHPDPPRAFEAGAQIHVARRQGEAARIGIRSDGWLTEPQLFSTDELGFRNMPGTAKRALAGFTLGNSFVYGAQLDDDETLAVQLGRTLGTTFYNAGSAFVPDVEWVEGMIQTLGLKGGVVVFGQLERVPPPKLQPQSKVPRPTPLLGPIQSIIQGVRSVDRRWSPLRQAAEEGFRAVHDPRWLRQQTHETVLDGTMRTGERIMFLGREEVESVTKPLDTPDLSYWKELQAMLREHNMELVVLVECGGPHFLDKKEALP